MEILTVYINADRGSDEMGDGTHKNPFKSVARALELIEDRDAIIRWDSALIEVVYGGRASLPYTNELNWG